MKGETYLPRQVSKNLAAVVILCYLEESLKIMS